MMSKDMKKEIPSILVEGTKDLVQRPVDVRDVEVEISFGEPMDEWIEEHYSYMDATLSATGGQLRFSVDDYRKYIRTIIVSRVNWIRGKRYVAHPTARFAVPTLISALLAAVGVVSLDDQGLVLLPTVSEPGELMNEDELKAVSNRLEVMAHHGFVFALGYERDKRGAFDLMVQQYLVNGEEGPGVYSHTKSAHPAFAVLAYFLQLKQMQDLLGARIVYGNRASMRSHLRGLVAA